MTTRPLLTSALALVAIAGCDPNLGGVPADELTPEYQAYHQAAEGTWNSARMVDAEGALFVSLLDGVDTGSPDAAIDGVVARLATALTPAGCATPVRAGATLTIAFAGCRGAGAAGLITGQLTLTASSAGDAVAFAASAPELTIGSATLTITSQIAIGLGADAGALVVDSQLAGRIDDQTPRVRGSYAVRATDGCVDIDGDWSVDLVGDAGGTTYGTTRTCGDACTTGALGRHVIELADLDVSSAPGSSYPGNVFWHAVNERADSDGQIVGACR